MASGAFVAADGRSLPPPITLPNGNMRLFGGAQFHRAMAEFRLAVGQTSCAPVSREDIVNACGVDAVHDGVNYVRTACVIAVSRAQELLEPFIHQLGKRLSHILRRLLSIAQYLVERDGPRGLSGHYAFQQKVGKAYHAFIDEVEDSCKLRCLEDLTSTTRYVSWSLHTKTTSALRNTLHTKLHLTDMLRPGSAAGSTNSSSSAKASQGGPASSGTMVAAETAVSVMTDLLESTLWQRQLGSFSEELVAALVAQVFEGIRDFIVQSVELKFNCFFLMPVIDQFPEKLRSQMEAAWEEDLEEFFDVSAVRANLEQRLKSMEAEQQQVERLQRKFSQIHSTLAVRASAEASISSTLTSLAKPLPSTGHHANDWPSGGALDTSASQSHCSSVLRDSAGSSSLAALAQKMKGVGFSQVPAASNGSGWSSGGSTSSTASTGQGLAVPGSSSRDAVGGAGTGSAAAVGKAPTAGGVKGGEGSAAAGQKAAAGDADRRTLPVSGMGTGQTGGERRGVGPLASGMGGGVGCKGHERPASSHGARDVGAGVAADRSGPKAHMIASMMGLPGN